MMNLKPLVPRKALNKAWLKTKPNRSQIEIFKKNLAQMLDHINETESEEFHKNLVSDFLKNTWYRDKYFINTKGREDLAIYTGKDFNSPVGVTIETKKPANKAEMLSFDNINTKALHELILYYLRERITGKNLELKYLIATNIYEWYIFNATDFEKWFANSKPFINKFIDFEEKRLSSADTDFFYKSIAAPFVESLQEEITFTYLDLHTVIKPLKDQNPNNDNKLIPFYKIFSPEHLLKLPFANDSNSLDRGFYNELLHIIGLEETKEGSKKVIGRNTEDKRNPGSLIENTITILNYEDCLSSLKRSQYGSVKDEQLFNVALELSITWINRILFLKLLEGQLVKYHRGDKSYRFLNTDSIPDYDALNKLFFQVLAVRENERNEQVNKKFGNIPYLNSSLFEPNELEHKTIRISNLEDEHKLPILSTTVLTDYNGKRINGEKNTLHYLFEFLDAYDFASEGSEEIQEENKTLINASVLGLIFEKINGYKDGSFFTPGFITMYMARETVRRSVIQKFNEIKEWSCKNIDELYNQIDNKQEANEIINSLKVCDPAVGSGHFLVSVLNEIIALKSDLKILSDRNGRILRDYHIEVVNDELVITDDEGCFFEYRPGNIEKQRVQEAIFHEKQTIIENCLFGVDINPNSVKICRLRLWIELLKNAYYKSGTKELETLPNIDINIKCGNSLISRYSLDSDLKQVLKSSKYGVDGYRLAVQTYRNAKDKEQKHEMLELIETIKKDFETEIKRTDKRVKDLSKLKSNLLSLTSNQLFDYNEKQKKEWSKKVKVLTDKIKKRETELEDIANNKIYNNAFEWRFEFPEVLNDEGDFIGFDIVIGNPPYVDIKALPKEIVKYLFSYYTTSSNRVNLYSTFVEMSNGLLKDLGYFAFIIPNSLLMGSSYQALRNYIKKEIFCIVKLPDRVFEDASVETIIIQYKKASVFYSCDTIRYSKNDVVTNINNSLKYEVPKKSWEIYDEPKYNIYISDKLLEPLLKIKTKGKKLIEVADFSLGITPYDKYKNHSEELINNKEYHSSEKLSDIYKPLIKGENIVPYYINPEVKEYIKYGHWLGAPREEKFFLEPRVIVRQIVSGKPPKIYAGYTDLPLYFTQIGFSIIPREYITPIELTALLNSKLLNFYHKFLFLDIEKELFQKILIENCKQFPCIKISNRDVIEQKVKDVLKRKAKDINADTSDIEIEIDHIIYEAYGLTEEEIKIIEETIQ